MADVAHDGALMKPDGAPGARHDPGAVAWTADMARRQPSRTRRAGAVSAIFLVLLGLGYGAGTSGVFSPSQRRLFGQLQDPAARLAATIELADQLVDDIETGHPAIPGIQAQQPCPAQWASRASSVIGALSPAEATSSMRAAAKRFAAAGWRVDKLSLGATRPTLTAHNRRGVDVSVVEQPGDTASSIEVTVSVRCPPSPGRPASVATATTTPTLTPPAGR